MDISAHFTTRIDAIFHGGSHSKGWLEIKLTCRRMFGDRDTVEEITVHPEDAAAAARLRRYADAITAVNGALDPAPALEAAE